MEQEARNFRRLLEFPIQGVCGENPIPHRHARCIMGDYTQVIQPWQFGHPESKATCLWLKNLPPLNPTNILPIPQSGRWENQTPSGQNRLGPSPTRAMDRSRTYQGIANAMAEQWLSYIEHAPTAAERAEREGRLW